MSGVDELLADGRSARAANILRKIQTVLTDEEGAELYALVSESGAAGFRAAWRQVGVPEVDRPGIALPLLGPSGDVFINMQLLMAAAFYTKDLVVSADFRTWATSKPVFGNVFSGSDGGRPVTLMYGAKLTPVSVNLPFSDAAQALQEGGGPNRLWYAMGISAQDINEGRAPRVAAALGGGALGAGSGGVAAPRDLAAAGQMAKELAVP